MRATPARVVVLAAAVWCTAGLAPGAARAAEDTGGAPPVVGVELVSRHRLPEELVRSAIGVGEMVGRPRRPRAVRDGLERLWSLGLFAEIRVDEVAEPGGVRLRYHLTRRPLIRHVAWRGEAGLDLGRLSAAAGLVLGEEASAERLERARAALLARYREEGYFAARVAVETEADAATAEEDVTLVLDAGKPAGLGRVRIQGVLGLPPQAVGRAFGLGESAPYREAIVRERVRVVEERLRVAGFFEARVTAAPPRWDATSNRVALDVDVQAGPRFEVEFSGNAALSASELRRWLTFAETGVVDEFEAATSARQLEGAYRERGYHFVAVSGTVAPDGEPRVVRFEVTEGPRVTVAAVTVSGNVAVPTERLLAAMETRPPAFLRPGLFRRDVLDRDVAALLALLREEGFADATVGPAEVRFTEERRQAHVRVPVAEGPRVIVDGLTVEGHTLVGTEEVLAAVPLQPGGPWSAERAEQGRRAIERLYARRGYLAVLVEVVTTRQDQAVSVGYRIREGAPTRMGLVRLSGLLLTREDVVRRQLRLEPGDPFDPDQLVEAQRRLGRIPAFDSVEVGPLRPPSAPFADVDVALSERPPWRLELGLGYDTAEGGRGYVEVGHDNLFGTARSASLRHKEAIGGEAIRRLLRTDATLREPSLFATTWQGQLDLAHEQSEQIGYDFRRLGLSVTVGPDLFGGETRGLSAWVRYRIDEDRFSNVDPGLQSQGVVAGREIVASLTPTLVWDWRDNRFDPRRGSRHAVSLEAGGFPLGGEVNFVKTQLETSWFFDWLPPTVLVLAGRLGLARPLGDTPALVIGDRFFAGGSTSVRGYRENRLGPRDAAGNPTGGNALAVVSAEWRFPLGGPLSGAVFADAGAVTPEVEDLRLDAFRSGVGAGLRLRTPVGPVRLDVGYALQPIPGDDRLQVYLTVGHAF